MCTDCVTNSLGGDCMEFLILMNMIALYMFIRTRVLHSRLQKLYPAILMYCLMNPEETEDGKLTLCDPIPLLEGINPVPPARAYLCFWDMGYRFIVTKEVYEKIEPYIF